MINAASLFTLMARNFTGNRLHAMVQFDMIDKTNNECLKGDKFRIITVLDHKQKFLGMYFVRSRWNILAKMA